MKKAVPCGTALFVCSSRARYGQRTSAECRSSAPRHLPKCRGRLLPAKWQPSRIGPPPRLKLAASETGSRHRRVQRASSMNAPLSTPTPDLPLHEPCIRFRLMENLMSPVQDGWQNDSRVDREADDIRT